MKSPKTELTQASCWTELTEWRGHSNSISLLHPSCTRIFSWYQGVVVQTTGVGWGELFHIVLFWDRLSHISGWAWTWYIASTSDPPKYRDCWHLMLWMEPTASCAWQALCWRMDLDSQLNYSFYCHWIWDTGSSSYLPSVVLLSRHLEVARRGPYFCQVSCL